MLTSKCGPTCCILCVFVVSPSVSHIGVWAKGEWERKKTPMPLRHFRSPLSAELIHCVLSSGAHRQALNRHQSEKMKRLNIYILNIFLEWESNPNLVALIIIHGPAAPRQASTSASLVVHFIKLWTRNISLTFYLFI